MSEYNVLINKYDALNAGYDQLYPKPMKHANTHAIGGTDPITPGDIGVYSKNETDTLLANKAPAGYGLGGKYGLDITGSTGDANNAKYNGWYTTNSDTANLPTNMPYSVCKEGTILTAVRAAQVKQIFFDNVYGYVATRLGNADTGTWGDWEWVNPPMNLGVEYRTTERYLGKPVYKKLMDCGYLPNTSSKIITYSDDENCRVIFACGAGISIPTVNLGGAIATTFQSDAVVSFDYGTNKFQVACGGDRSNLRYKAIVAYYKTTD